MKWTDKHLTVLGFRPTESLMQEWILGQMCSNAELFDAKQRDPQMTNPTSAEMIAFLYTQSDMLFGRKGIARLARADRVLMIKDQQALSSDEDTARPTTQIFAIYGHPHLNTRGSDKVAPFIRTCPLCNGGDIEGTCVSSGRCRGNKGISYQLQSTDMRASRDAKGFRKPGHFSRDCPQMSEEEKAVRIKEGHLAHTTQAALSAQLTTPRGPARPTNNYAFASRLETTTT